MLRRGWGGLGAICYLPYGHNLLARWLEHLQHSITPSCPHSQRRVTRRHQIHNFNLRTYTPTRIRFNNTNIIGFIPYHRPTRPRRLYYGRLPYLNILSLSRDSFKMRVGITLGVLGGLQWVLTSLSSPVGWQPSRSVHCLWPCPTAQHTSLQHLEVACNSGRLPR